jgi:hypothetical protein
MSKFKIYTQDPVIGYDARTRQPVRRYRNHDKPFNWYKVFFWGVMIFIFLGMASCSSYEPLVDSRGKSSANLQGDMNRYHDDLYTCQQLVEENTNDFIDTSKVVYNKFRWRVLWLSPKLETSKDYVKNCMAGRGYSIIK